jgi:hypothetical protein
MFVTFSAKCSHFRERFMFWGWQHTCPAQSVLATALPLAL